MTESGLHVVFSAAQAGYSPAAHLATLGLSCGDCRCVDRRPPHDHRQLGRAQRAAVSIMSAFGETVLTARRLLLTPLRPDDAEQMAIVLVDERLHEFIGGSPASPAVLLARYRALAAGSPDPGEIWLNWIVRMRDTGKPVGTVQATVSGQDDGWNALVAWVIGVPWQGQGFASEAARALVTWLSGRGTRVITAHIHPQNHASAAVAARAGFAPTDGEADGERVWRHIPALG